ncbi:MAG: serine/threonine-protein kinase [Nocardioides sp.]|uniref:serine/threonine-protein kinase n=1 Tax=Nocardioides sp. TaxID=35761 RepID=UPI003262EFA2
MTGDGSGHAAWKPPAPATSQPPTESLTGYSDLHQIGVGGDSVVYRATEDTLGRDAAIKVLNVDDEARAARFAREVEITLDLGRQHPNIVTVLATGITGSGRPAIVMEFYPGGTLHDRLKEFGPLPVDEVVRIGLVLADALSFAHDRGVLHRDVKPQNVLVLPTSWVLADFGIARLVDSEHTSSVETFTYRHASPQVLDGHAPTAADDIWSLGSTLYTLVDGRPPFASDDPDNDSALAYLRRARIEPHRPLAVPGTEALAAVIDRCLAKDVEGRWSSAGELHDAMLGLRHRAWEPGVPATPAPAATPEPEAAAPSEHTGHAWAPAADSHREPGEDTRPRARRPTDLDSRLTGDGDRPPAPVALSAAAHVPVDAPVDAEPTGMGLPVEHREPLPVLAPEPVAPAPTRKRRLVIGLGVLALVIGTALGVTGAVLRDEAPAETPAADDGRAGQQIPELTDKPEETDPNPAPFDPALSFEFVGLTYQGGNLVASWQDISDGEAFFHISQVKPQAYLRVFDVGQTESEFPYQLGLGRTCFVVVMHMPDESLGLSNQRCLRNAG